jgi:hypothetical protein
MIFVFKTSVKNKQQVKQLAPHFNSMLTDCKWNFDLEDCDKILRIESEDDIVWSITDLLHEKGFQCTELG